MHDYISPRISVLASWWSKLYTRVTSAADPFASLHPVGCRPPQRRPDLPLPGHNELKNRLAPKRFVRQLSAFPRFSTIKALRNFAQANSCPRSEKPAPSTPLKVLRTFEPRSKCPQNCPGIAEMLASRDSQSAGHVVIFQRWNFKANLSAVLERLHSVSVLPGPQNCPGMA